MCLRINKFFWLLENLLNDAQIYIYCLSVCAGNANNYLCVAFKESTGADCNLIKRNNFYPFILLFVWMCASHLFDFPNTIIFWYGTPNTERQKLRIYWKRKKHQALVWMNSAAAGKTNVFMCFSSVFFQFHLYNNNIWLSPIQIHTTMQAYSYLLHSAARWIRTI